ncbi:SusD/RagB family nutrient-binding outer membrane lipoprotein [Sinomicrobium oceani]|uniref:SusD/RagB family nutrient-binding outer membrane lipoprotein n=1 Tax=Sinomicrobium oceani TaxID=1150368 RepID=UPI00227B60FA|nr:SusD/RagB family nutrient-binding outer membrane lipoprotein [Sinomicrobium oceani]
MKNIYIKIAGFIFFMSLIVSGCSDYLDINEDPDSPTYGQITESVLLPGILSSVSYELTGGYPARASSLWTQQIATTGTGRGISTLFLQDPDVNNTWKFTLYTGVLKNARLMQEKAIESESPQYEGIAYVVQAYGVSILADFWGDAPWSEALNDDIEKPVFDSQEELYTAIDDLLEKAISTLDAAINAGGTVNGDLLYNGDVEKWKKLAYSLRARYAMRLIYAKGDDQADMVLAYFEDGFASNQDDAGFVFEDKENANNPWVQWQDKWTNLFVNKFVIDKLEADSDPRVDAFALKSEAEDIIVGGENGAVIQLDSVSLLSTQNAQGALSGRGYYINNESAVDWMTYSELMFLASEAYLFKGDIVNAQDYLHKGIKANLQKIVSNGTLNIEESDMDQFANGFILPVDFESAQKMIIEQKYIANYLQIEPYNDYRRTGYPEIPLPEVHFNDQIPVRFPYPTDPILNNKANMPVVNYATDKVWWDQK